jgi:type VI protein secretion system component Hcp
MQPFEENISTARKERRKQRWLSSLALKRNTFAGTTKPEHGDITITKLVDNATPQLAFACSAQEPIWYTFLYFRRRIGGGISGVRMPFLTIGLYKSLITSWGIGGNMTETIKMNYKSIAWASIPPWSDTNLALAGIPAMRWWSNDDVAGGNKGGWALLMQGLTAALVAAAGVMAKGVEAAQGMTGGL